MKTKELIKNAALQLFNREGVNHVTLRNVAEELNKSYGNITYHFPTKHVLVEALYDEMQQELVNLGKKITTSEDKMFELLRAPDLTYDHSAKYLFLWKDYLEIIRQFPEVAQKVERNNEIRKVRLKQWLLDIRAEGFLRADLDETDLDFLMDASGAIRLQFFMVIDPKIVSHPKTKRVFVDKVNRLLKPYLSTKGLECYSEFMKNYSVEN